MPLLQATEMALWFAVAEVGSVEAVAVAWGLTWGWCLYSPLVEVGRRMGLSFVGKGLSGQCYRRHRAIVDTVGGEKILNPGTVV